MKCLWLLEMEDRRESVYVCWSVGQPVSKMTEENVYLIGGVSEPVHSTRVTEDDGRELASIASLRKPCYSLLILFV